MSLLTVAYVSGPILVIAMAVGVVVALFQVTRPRDDHCVRPQDLPYSS